MFLNTFQLVGAGVQERSAQCHPARAVASWGLLNLLFSQFLPAFQPFQLTHGPTVLRHATQTSAAQLIFWKKEAKNIRPLSPQPRAWSIGWVSSSLPLSKRKKKIKHNPQTRLTAWFVPVASLQTFNVGIKWEARQEQGKAASVQGCGCSGVTLSYNTGCLCSYHLPPASPFLACNALPPSITTISILLFYV